MTALPHDPRPVDEDGGPQDASPAEPEQTGDGGAGGGATAGDGYEPL